MYAQTAPVTLSSLFAMRAGGSFSHFGGAVGERRMNGRARPDWLIAESLPCRVVSAGRGTIRVAARGRVSGHLGADRASLRPGGELRQRFLAVERPGRSAK